LKFLDLMFFNLDLLTSDGLSTIRSTPSDSQLVPLQSTVSYFVFRYSHAGVCTPCDRV
jgi:hypothetical protein